MASLHAVRRHQETSPDTRSFAQVTPLSKMADMSELLDLTAVRLNWQAVLDRIEFGEKPEDGPQPVTIHRGSAPFIVGLAPQLYELCMEALGESAHEAPVQLRVPRQPGARIDWGLAGDAKRIAFDSRTCHQFWGEVNPQIGLGGKDIFVTKHGRPRSVFISHGRAMRAADVLGL